MPSPSKSAQDEPIGFSGRLADLCALDRTDKPKKVKIISTGLGLDRDHDDIKVSNISVSGSFLRRTDHNLCYSRQSLKLFGAAWTDNSKDATHLVVKGISRTEKFLCSASS